MMPSSQGVQQGKGEGGVTSQQEAGKDDPEDDPDQPGDQGSHQQGKAC